MSTISVIVVDTETPTWTRKTLEPKDFKKEIDCELLEFVDLGEGLGMYLDEEGKLYNKPVNMLMTKLFCAITGDLYTLAGTVILVGRAAPAEYESEGTDYVSAPDWVETVLNNIKNASLIVIEDGIEPAKLTQQAEFFNKGIAVATPLLEACLADLRAATHTSNLIGYDLYEVYLNMQAAMNSQEVPEVKLVRVLKLSHDLWAELDKFQVFTNLYHPGKYEAKVINVRSAICYLTPLLGAVISFMERNKLGGPIQLIEPNFQTPSWTEGAALFEDLLLSSPNKDAQTIVNAMKPYLKDSNA